MGPKRSISNLKGGLMSFRSPPSSLVPLAALTILAASCDDGSHLDGDVPADGDADFDFDFDSDEDDGDPFADAEIDAEVDAWLVVGPEGGVIEVPGVARLDIPAGALEEDALLTITVEDLPEPGDSGLVWTTGSVSLGPHGIGFLEPVVLTLTYDPDLVPEDALDDEQAIYTTIDGVFFSVDGARAPEEDEDTEELDGPSEMTVVDVETHTMSVGLRHFSTYTGAARNGSRAFFTQRSGPDAIRVLGKRTKSGSGYVQFLRDYHIRTKTVKGLKVDYQVPAPINANVDYIILHHTAGTSRLNGYFKNSGLHGKFAAQYYVGRNGVIAQAAATKTQLWHASVNSRSVGIEIVNSGAQEYPPAQVMAVRRLVNYLSGEQDIPLRGRYQEYFGVTDNVREPPPTFYPTTTPRPGKAPEAYDRVLTHREVDQHEWVVEASFAKGRTINFTADSGGRFCRADCSNRCVKKTHKTVASGAVFSVRNKRRSCGAPSIIFRPAGVTSTATTITITAQPVDAAGNADGDPDTVSYRLDLAPNAAGEWETLGARRDAAGTPLLVASRRKHDVGGTEDFPLNALIMSLYYSVTGYINASGGDGLGVDTEGGTPGDGGDVLIEAGVSFPAGHFDKAESTYLSTMYRLKTDEAVRDYILHVKNGETKSLAAGEHDLFWLVVEGTLEVEGAAKVRAAGGIYVGPSGKILSRDPTGGEIDGYDLTLETLGEALVLGVVDSSGHDGELSEPQAGGSGGDVTIRMLAGRNVYVPSIITRGGDTDETDGVLPGLQPGKGGNVTIIGIDKATHLVLTGGNGAEGADPEYPISRMTPSPPHNLGTDLHAWPEIGERPELYFTKGRHLGWERGIITIGGTGGCPTAELAGVGTYGGPGGDGGDVLIEAHRLTFTDVAIWTGAGLEPMQRYIALPGDDFPTTPFEVYTGSAGGAGRTGSAGGMGGGHGGDGGAAGDVTFAAAEYFPEFLGLDTRQVLGWDHDTPLVPTLIRPIGLIILFNANVPTPAGEEYQRFLRVVAVGGSGGFPGGGASSAGWFGRKGADGVLTGLPGIP